MHYLSPVAQAPLHTRTGAGAGPRVPYHPGTPPLTLRLLGRFAASRGHQIVSTLGGRDGGRLVRYLLVHREHAVAEAEILEVLWPALSQEEARANLRLAVTGARYLLDTPDGPGSTLSTGGGRYRLCLGWHDRVDADYFESVAGMALLDHGPGRRAKLDHALACWTGEPLPEEHASAWAAGWRDRLLGLHTALIEARAELPRPGRTRVRRHVSGSTASPAARAF